MIEDSRPPDANDKFELELDRKRLATLAHGVLQFRRNAADALDELLCEMIKSNAEIGSWKFETAGENARPCVVLVGVGEDAAEFVKKISKGFIK